MFIMLQIYVRVVFVLLKNGECRTRKKLSIRSMSIRECQCDWWMSMWIMIMCQQ